MKNAICFAAEGGGSVWRENGDTPLEKAIETLLERPLSVCGNSAEASSSQKLAETVGL